MNVSVNNTSDVLTPVGVSDLGTVIYDNVVFPAGNYTDINDVIQSYDEVQLDAVSFTVNRTKNVIISNISGRNGAVKEYIAANDYNISINAILTQVTNVAVSAASTALGQTGVSSVTGFVGLTATYTPITELTLLKELEDATEAVQIRSKILQNVFNITSVVIQSVAYEPIASDTWRVKIECIEDKDIDLKDIG